MEINWCGLSIHLGFFCLVNPNWMRLVRIQVSQYLLWSWFRKHNASQGQSICFEVVSLETQCHGYESEKQQSFFLGLSRCNGLTQREGVFLCQRWILWYLLIVLPYFVLIWGVSFSPRARVLCWCLLCLERDYSAL